MENFELEKNNETNEKRNQRNLENGNLNNPDGKLVRGGIEMDLHKVQQSEILDI